MRKEKIPLRCKIRKHFQQTISPYGAILCEYGLSKQPKHLCINCPLSLEFKMTKAFTEVLRRGEE